MAGFGSINSEGDYKKNAEEYTVKKVRRTLIRKRKNWASNKANASKRKTDTPSISIRVIEGDKNPRLVTTDYRICCKFPFEYYYRVK